MKSIRLIRSFESFVAFLASSVLRRSGHIARLLLEIQPNQAERFALVSRAAPMTKLVCMSSGGPR